VVDLGAPAQRLGEWWRSRTGRDHELLDVDVGVGVRAAVEDVEHGYGQQVGRRPAEVAEQRQLGRVGGGLRHREGDAEDRVGAEARLVGRAVEVDQRLVDEPLLAGVVAEQRRADLVEHRERRPSRRPCRP
jgi:hypothetical protein